jgi:putative ABC transport system permease protein
VPEKRSAADWRDLVRHRLRGSALESLPPEREAGVLAEIAVLVEDVYEERRAAGSEPELALEEALRSVGDWDTLAFRVANARRRERRRQRPYESGGSSMTTHLGLLADLRTALRALLRNPGFSIAACAVLALGIGANVAIFSVVHGVLLDPLPYPDADRLAVVVVDALGREGLELISASNLIDFEEQAATLSALGVVSTFEVDLELDGLSETYDAAFVSPSLLEMLGMRALTGRTFDEDVDSRAQSLGNVLLSERLWRQRFGADPAIIGRSLSANGQPVEVVGVLAGDPRMLIAPGLTERVDLWSARPLPVDRGTVLRYRALVRIAEGETPESASAELGEIYRRTHRLDFSDDQDLDIVYRVVPIAENLLAPYRRPLLALLGAVACVLLLMCANLANLLLVRGLRRRGEWAVRAALGAGAWRLVRLGIAESLLLAAAGGLGGVLVAIVGIRVLLGRAPLELPRLSDVGMDLPVLGFALGAALASALLAGAAPAFRVATDSARARFDQRGGRSGLGRTGRLLGALQMAIAMVLLTGSGLMLRTLGNLRSADLGFETAGRHTFSLELRGESADDDAERLRLQRALLGRLEQIPGIDSASLARGLPLVSSLNLATFAYDEATVRDFGALTGSFHRIFPGYFRTLGVPILAGRDFEPADTDHERDVVLVSASFAAHAWPGRSPLDERLLIDFATADDGTERRWAQVVGVVPEVCEETIEAPFFPQIYLPFHARTQGRRVVLSLSARPITMAGAIQEAIDDVAPGGEASDLLPLGFFVDEVTAETRFVLALIGAFSVLALILASLGVYGVISHLVSTRRREIGVRVALGAQRIEVFGLVLRQGLALAGIGLTIGAAAAVYLTRLLRSFLFEVAPGDPVSLAAVLFLLLLVAALASALPARRAAAVDPNLTLRCDG